LGLAIVAEIVRQHHGRLQIESNSEGDRTGTAVTFSLPCLLPAYNLLPAPAIKL
jgi:signal transduction histidine kinase